MTDLAARIAAQRAVLHDPITFAAMMWEPVFSTCHFLGDLGHSAYDCPERDNVDEAFRVVERSLTTAGLDTVSLLGYLSDLITTLSMHHVDVGRLQGVVLERLRQDMIAFFAAVDVERADTHAADDARELRELHARLDASEGRLLVDLRATLAAKGRLDDPANDGGEALPSA